MPTIKLLSGSYTGPGGAGLTLLNFDTETGAFAHVRDYPGTPDASWIAFNPDSGTVYVTDEMAGKVGAFALAEDLTSAAPLGYVATGADYPCYLSLNPARTQLAVANYGDDSVPVFGLGSSGALAAGPVLRGTKPHDRGHAHWTQWSPEGDRLYVVDLGHDEVRSFAYDAAAGAFGTPEVAYAAPKGAGPRHLAFQPGGRFAYLFTEYSNELIALERSPDGRLAEIMSLSALPPGYAGRPHGAHIQLSLEGRFAYVSTRGPNEIVVFRIGADGRISRLQSIDCGGDFPRFFILLGRHLVVANQKSDTLVTFDVADDGSLSPNGSVFPLAAPVALLPI